MRVFLIAYEGALNRWQGSEVREVPLGRQRESEEEDKDSSHVNVRSRQDEGDEGHVHKLTSRRVA